MEQSNQKNHLSTNSGNLVFDVFKPQLLHQHLQIALSHIEKYLLDPTIRGLALTNPHELLNQTKHLMAEEVNDEVSLNKNSLKS